MKSSTFSPCTFGTLRVTKVHSLKQAASSINADTLWRWFDLGIIGFTSMLAVKAISVTGFFQTTLVLGFYNAYPSSLLVYTGLMGAVTIKKPGDAIFVTTLAIVLSELSYNLVFWPPGWGFFPLWFAGLALAIAYFKRFNPTWLLPVYVLESTAGALHLPAELAWPYYVCNELFICLIAWRMVY